MTHPLSPDPVREGGLRDFVAVDSSAGAEQPGCEAPFAQRSTPNAQPSCRHSGGPRTPEGKKRSSLNSLKHGLDAVSPHALELLARDAGITFEAIHADMREHYRPTDKMEEQLVRRIARCLFRLAIGESMEKRLLTRRAGPARPSVPYDRVLKFERLVDIHLHRAIAALQHKRDSENRSNTRNELPPRSG